MNRDFKGIWIPREIWLIPDLKPSYRVFLAEIDSLDKGNGCWAQNSHFSALFGLSKNRCSEIISMLEKKKLIKVTHQNSDGEIQRRIRLSTPSENRQTPSENRQTPSENRQTPSENRTPIYKVLEIQLEIHESDARASCFLLENYESRLEAFWLNNHKMVNDHKKFWADFDDTVQLEGLDFSDRLFGRLRKWSRNWIEFQNRNGQKNIDADRTVSEMIGKRLV